MRFMAIVGDNGPEMSVRNGVNGCDRANALPAGDKVLVVSKNYGGIKWCRRWWLPKEHAFAVMNVFFLIRAMTVIPFVLGKKIGGKTTAHEF